jgi:hypothetical protein
MPLLKRPNDGAPTESANKKRRLSSPRYAQTTRRSETTKGPAGSPSPSTSPPPSPIVIPDSSEVGHEADFALEVDTDGKEDEQDTRPRSSVKNFMSNRRRLKPKHRSLSPVQRCDENFHSEGETDEGENEQDTHSQSSANGSGSNGNNARAKLRESSSRAQNSDEDLPEAPDHGSTPQATSRVEKIDWLKRRRGFRLPGTEGRLKRPDNVRLSNYWEELRQKVKDDLHKARKEVLLIEQEITQKQEDLKSKTSRVEDIESALKRLEQCNTKC